MFNDTPARKTVLSASLNKTLPSLICAEIDFVSLNVLLFRLLMSAYLEVFVFLTKCTAEISILFVNVYQQQTKQK